MLIDWFTVGAQFVNFIVLVILLKKLFYHPVLNAMAAREQRVAGLLRDAANKQAAAQAELNLIQKQEHDLERQRTDLLKKAADEAEVSRQELIANAKEEVADMRQRWIESVKHEKERIEKDLLGNLQSEVLGLMRGILRDLAGTQLEEEIVKKFVCELKTVSATDRARLRSDTKLPIIVRSSFEIPLQAQAGLQKSIEQELGARAVRFEITPELVCGIELATTGHKLSWNIQDWLHSFQRSLEESSQTANAHAQS